MHPALRRPRRRSREKTLPVRERNLDQTISRQAKRPRKRGNSASTARNPATCSTTAANASFSRNRRPRRVADLQALLRPHRPLQERKLWPINQRILARPVVTPAPPNTRNAISASRKARIRKEKRQAEPPPGEWTSKRRNLPRN